LKVLNNGTYYLCDEDGNPYKKGYRVSHWRLAPYKKQPSWDEYARMRKLSQQITVDKSLIDNIQQDEEQFLENKKILSVLHISDTLLDLHNRIDDRQQLSLTKYDKLMRDQLNVAIVRLSTQ